VVTVPVFQSDEGPGRVHVEFKQIAGGIERLLWLSATPFAGEDLALEIDGDKLSYHSTSRASSPDVFDRMAQSESIYRLDAAYPGTWSTSPSEAALADMMHAHAVAHALPDSLLLASKPPAGIRKWCNWPDPLVRIRCAGNRRSLSMWPPLTEGWSHDFFDRWRWQERSPPPGRLLPDPSDR
jgi:hypothetical protein